MKYLEKIYGHGLVLQDRLLESYNKNKDKNYVLKLSMVALILGAIGFNAYYSQKPYQRIDYSNVETKDLVFPLISYTNELNVLQFMLEDLKKELNINKNEVSLNYVIPLDNFCFDKINKEKGLCVIYDSNTKTLYSITTLIANTNEASKKSFYVINKFKKDDNNFWDYVFIDGVINVDDKNDVLYTLDKTNGISKKIHNLKNDFLNKENNKESIVLNNPVLLEKLYFLREVKNAKSN